MTGQSDEVMKARLRVAATTTGCNGPSKTIHTETSHEQEQRESTPARDRIRLRRKDGAEGCVLDESGGAASKKDQPECHEPR